MKSPVIYVILGLVHKSWQGSPINKQYFMGRENPTSDQQRIWRIWRYCYWSKSGQPVEVGSLSQSFTRFFTSQVVSRISSTNFMFRCLGVGFPYISCVHTGKKGEGSSVSEIFGDKESPSSQCRKDFPNIRGIAWESVLYVPGVSWKLPRYWVV